MSGSTFRAVSDQGAPDWQHRRPLPRGDIDCLRGFERHLIYRHGHMLMALFSVGEGDLVTFAVEIGSPSLCVWYLVAVLFFFSFDSGCSDDRWLV